MDGDITSQASSAVTDIVQSNGDKITKKRKHGDVRDRCVFSGCENDNTAASMRRILPRVTTPEPNHRRLRDIRRYYQKKVFYELTLIRCGLSRNNDCNNLQICDGHELEEVKVKRDIVRDGKVTTLWFVATVPSGKGMANESKTSLSKGVALDRSTARILISIREDDSKS